MNRDELWLRYYELMLRSHVEAVRAGSATPNESFPEQAARFADAAVLAWTDRKSPQPQSKAAPTAGRTR